MSKNNFFRLPDTPDGGFDIKIRLCMSSEIDSWTYPGSIHCFLVFYWNPDPGAFLECEGRNYELLPDQAFLIPPYTRYSTTSRKKFLHFYVHFSAPAPFDRIRRGILAFTSTAVRNFFRKLSDGNQAVQYIRLREMLYHYLGEIPAGQFPGPGENILDPRIRLAAELMNANLKKPLSNRELCRKSGLNLNDFYRRFRQELGITPKKYLLSLRMECAREKLLHSDDTLEEIAEAAGYADRFQFSKAFRQFYAIPPAAFRSRYKI